MSFYGPSFLVFLETFSVASSFSCEKSILRAEAFLGPYTGFDCVVGMFCSSTFDGCSKLGACSRGVDVGGLTSAEESGIDSVFAGGVVIRSSCFDVGVLRFVKGHGVFSFSVSRVVTICFSGVLMIGEEVCPIGYATFSGRLLGPAVSNGVSFQALSKKNTRFSFVLSGA